MSDTAGKDSRPISKCDFEATIEKAPDSAACGIIVLSDYVMQCFGRVGRVPVVVTIKGYTYRSSLAPMGGSHVLPVNATVRGAAGVAAGDKVLVHLKPDLHERIVDIPADLRRELAIHKCRLAFDALSFTHRKEWVATINGAKHPETRSRRIAACITGMLQKSR